MSENIKSSGRAATKPRGRPFEKGRSGNPKGREKIDPAIREQVNTALRAATVDAVNVLTDMLTDDRTKPDLRIKCAEIVLDRVYGKATQPIDGNIDSTVQIILGAAADYAD